MRLRLVAIGKLKTSPESDLVADYTQRFNKLGRSLVLGPMQLIELEDRRSIGKSHEASLILRAIPEDTILVALDEKGAQTSSVAFASFLAAHSTDGHKSMTFVIGGANGLHASVTERCSHLLSFGKMVWPHKLVRVMLTEQLYRAATILAGTPYHRP